MNLKSILNNHNSMYKSLFYIILYISILFNIEKLYSQDTIELNEVVIKEDFTRKPKIRKIEHGDRKNRFNDFTIFNETTPLLYLIDNIPYGILQEIEFKFSASSPSIGSGMEINNFIVNKTEYEVSIFQETENNEGLKKINVKPLIVSIPESKNLTHQVIVDVSSLNLKSNQFYILLEKITETLCTDCYYYIPQFFKSTESKAFLMKDNIGENQIRYKTPGIMKGLLVKIKTLTRDYK